MTTVSWVRRKTGINLFLYKITNEKGGSMVLRTLLVMILLATRKLSFIATCATHYYLGMKYIYSG
jgi:hypothetical protein